MRRISLITNKTLEKFELLCNWAELIGIIFVLILALIVQLFFHELPCPLCLLQRVGFMGMAFGLLLNLRFGFRPSHYSFVILSGLFTCFVALRQIALHVIPGTGAYGSPILGLHLYTWSFIVAMTIVVVTTLLLGLDRQYKNITTFKPYKILTTLFFSTMLIIVLLNVVSVFFECGIQECPDNPTQYMLVVR